MGTVIHEATLVTTFDPAMAIAAHREAERIFPSSMVTAIELSPINKYNTFVILPCGSKEGWPDKARDKADRTAFLDWVKGQAYEDGSNALEIGSVRYGNDLPTPGADFKAGMLRAADELWTARDEIHKASPGPDRAERQQPVLPRLGKRDGRPVGRMGYGAGGGMTDHPPDQDPTTIRAQIAAVTIYVTCECGEAFCHEIECEEDDFGGWSAAPEDRFILCETCDRLIDAGLQISIGVPA